MENETTLVMMTSHEQRREGLYIQVCTHVCTVNVYGRRSCNEEKTSRMYIVNSSICT